MAALRRLGFGGRRSGLRRFSPERAKSTQRVRGAQPLAQASEKLVIAIATGAVSVLLAGLGLGYGTREWTALTVLVAVGLGLFGRYLLDYRRAALDSASRVLGLGVLILLPLASLRLLEGFVGVELLGFLPLACLSLVVAIVWNRAVAFDGTLLMAGGMALFLMLRGELQVAGSGFAICLSGGLSAALFAGDLRRRMAVVRVGLGAGLVMAAVAGGVSVLEGGETWGIGAISLLALEGLAIGLIVTGLLPAIEAVFGVTTDVSLLELGNTHEQPLLRKLLLDAPGTFHHSYIVGLISEAAAEAVGADPLLARVGSLYHDVGKLNKPAYFAENSPDASQRHKALTPEMSTLVISSHPRDGVEVGQYFGLPRALLDFMPEHHGTSCIEYFYHRACQMRGEEHVNKADFRYPGPKPQRIETAIVMIADAVEAIARQMKEPTQARLSEMVHEVATKRLNDRQFDECGLTLKQLARIEEACVRVLVGLHHTRQSFPKRRPHPLDLSQPGEEREAAQRELEARRASSTQ